MKSNIFKIVLILYYLFEAIVPNLIVNHDFSDNQLNFGGSDELNSIKGWICNSTCQLVECHSREPTANCSGNSLDLDVGYIY